MKNKKLLLIGLFALIFQMSSCIVGPYYPVRPMGTWGYFGWGYPSHHYHPHHYGSHHYHPRSHYGYR